MASPIKHRIEPLFGWLFVVGVLAAVGFVVLAATRPNVEQTARLPVSQGQR